MKTRLLTALFGALALTVVVAAAPHHFLKQEFYVYDAGTKDFVTNATVTIAYEGGSQTADTGSTGEDRSVTFVVPGEVNIAHVTVVADGYEPYDGDIPLSHRPHNGGKAFWIGLTPSQK